MNPVDKALWYIESRSNASVCLDDIAAHAGMSKYYLLRAFAAATGLSIMRYVRGRRLSEAARRLAAGAEDILSVAIESGYGSHEAFTRAFRDQFDVTPETVRKRRRLDSLQLIEAISTGNQEFISVDPPRFEKGRLLLVAGINRYYTGIEAGASIPGQWHEFEAYRNNVHGRIGSATYGVCYAVDDEGSMDYLCGVEVRSLRRYRGSSRVCDCPRCDTWCSSIANTSRRSVRPGTRSGTIGCHDPATKRPTLRSSNVTTTVSTSAPARVASNYGCPCSSDPAFIRSTRMRFPFLQLILGGVLLNIATGSAPASESGIQRFGMYVVVADIVPVRGVLHATLPKTALRQDSPAHRLRRCRRPVRWICSARSIGP